jgi:hypothetical protein
VSILALNESWVKLVLEREIAISRLRKAATPWFRQQQMCPHCRARGNQRYSSAFACLRNRTDHLSQTYKEWNKWMRSVLVSCTVVRMLNLLSTMSRRHSSIFRDSTLNASQLRALSLLWLYPRGRNLQTSESV